MESVIRTDVEASTGSGFEVAGLSLLVLGKEGSGGLAYIYVYMYIYV